MASSWLQALLQINIKQRLKINWCKNKETDSPSGIYRNEVTGDMLTMKGELWKKKKMGLLFLGSGTPTFRLGLLLFIKVEPGTPAFKILERILGPVVQS